MLYHEYRCNVFKIKNVPQNKLLIFHFKLYIL